MFTVNLRRVLPALDDAWQHIKDHALEAGAARGWLHLFSLSSPIGLVSGAILRVHRLKCLVCCVPGAEPGRCGWRWCLESLVPVPGPEEEREGSPGDDQRSKVAAAIRKLRAR